MRARRRSKSAAKQEIFNFPGRIFIDTSTYKDNNREFLKNNIQLYIQKYAKNGMKKIRLEIGMGSGNFLNEIANRNPDTLYIGIEIKEERILDAMTEASERNIENTIFIRIFADSLNEIFTEQQIDTIYMNFPDPWPKKRHIKNRLTTEKFLKVYEKILKTNGEFVLKTDNDNMYEYSLEMLTKSRIKPTATEKELKNDETNIETKFEERYRKRNKNIFQIVAIKQ